MFTGISTSASQHDTVSVDEVLLMTHETEICELIAFALFHESAVNKAIETLKSKKKLTGVNFGPVSV